MRTRGCLPLALAVLLLLWSGTPSAAQVSTTTATLRGTVEDTTGGVVPGATVTLTDVGTKAARTAVTDERGGYTFTGLFPATYELLVEIAGFKTQRLTGITLAPNDTRGVDVRLEVGAREETVVVTTPGDIVQTETGAREGRVTAQQIENLSVISRSALELLRILPGVVAPDQNELESVSFGGGANNTSGYTVNGIRSSNNQVSLDGSALIDIGCNCGEIVSLNNDMVQEVSVQSANFNAEYGAGGMNVTAVTKGGTSKFDGTLYWYGRDHHLAANDRSNTITGVEKPRSQFFYPGGNVGGPILVPGWDFTKSRDRLFFFFGLEVQRQKIDPGTRLGVVPTLKQRSGDFSESLVENGQNLGQPVGPVLIPQGFPDAGMPAPSANLAPYTVEMGRILTNLYPAPNYADADNRYNYVYSQLEPTNRLDMKMRFDWNVAKSTKAYVRIARETEDVEGARGVWWGASDVALPSPNLGTNKGRSVSGNIVTVLSPTMTNEALVSWSQLKLDNAYKDPRRMTLAGNGITGFVPSFPGESPYIPGVLPNFGGGVSNLWSGANDLYAHNDELTFSDKLTKIAGAHGLKFGLSVQRLQKQQNFNNNEEGYVILAPSWTPGSTGNAVGDLLTGRLTQWFQGTRVPDGEYRTWNVDAFAQDSWKLRPNLTLDYGIRAGYWTNNAELNGLGGWFDPSAYDPSQPQFLDPGTFRVLNGVCYVSSGCAPPGIFNNRSPFAMPRVNIAWNIDGEGGNVLRGGYGLFYNRPQGNVEYDNTMRMPPAVYSIWQDAYGGADYGNGLGLTYSTVHEATLATRMGSVGINTLTPGSFTFPTTHSFSVSYARRLFWNQTLEAAYVGTRGRDLFGVVNGNPVPLGALSSGVIGNADLSVPVNRMVLDLSVVNAERPFPVYPGILRYDFEGTSRYDSLQVTLSRQAAKRLQYFVAYTLGRTKGTLGGDYGYRDPFDPSRTYGILSEDRRHILNVSWNAMLPDGARGALDHAVWRGILNGWQLSGISTFVSGTPIRLGFSGDAGTMEVAQAFYGTPDIIQPTGRGLAPEFTCDPTLGGKAVGEKVLDLSCVKVPDFGSNPPLIPPYDLRAPSRANHDLTLFKNFPIRGDQKLQFRAGFFNLFNTAYPSTINGHADVDLMLDTRCNRRVDGVPNGIGGYIDGVCDPTGGYSFTDTTKENFGKIILKRGHRVIELVVKYYF